MPDANAGPGFPPPATHAAQITPPPFADESAVTAWPEPVSNTFCHEEQSVSVQLVFQPSLLTQTNRPPISQTFAFCWSWMSGVTNLAAGSQPGLGVSPSVSWPTHVGLTK